MDVGKARKNFDKDRMPKCINCNIYEHMAKDCRKPKKKQDARKCYKYNKIEHIAKDCRSQQKIKNRSVQEESNEESNNKQKNFVKGLE